MQTDIHREVLTRIDRDYSLRKVSGQWMRGGTCPVCSKKELYTHKDEPWVLRCGRESKCNAELHVKDLYDDLFDDWSNRFKPTPQDPTITARAYLEFNRGFREELIKGWYTQEQYFDRDLGIGTATIRFQLPNDSWWERLIDRPHRFGKKARFKYQSKHNGWWWCPPCVDLLQTKELWLVEGIFDAIALAHNSITAVTSLSSNNYPELALAQLAKDCDAAGVDRPKLVWALDGDAAGRRYTRKWVAKAREAGWKCSAMQIPQRDKKIDWNEAHQRDRLTGQHIAEYRYHGDLLLAESATEKAFIMWSWKERHEFHFTFDSRMYWFKMDLGKYNKALVDIEESDHVELRALSRDQQRQKALEQSGGVAQIANCYPQALYFQRNEVTDESWYYFRVDFPHDGGSIKNTFTGGQVSAASEFKKRLLSIAAGAVYTGSGQQLDRIMQDQLYGIKTVETIDYIGYSKEYKAYVFRDLAVRNGTLSEVNDQDYFEFGKLRLKTLEKSIPIKIERDSAKYREDWLPLLWLCFNTSGIVALAFWFGSLFAEQIRAQHESFPFLELTGKPGSGKSTLIMFLWKLLGRNHEGFDAQKSSKAGRQRYMAQLSNLPLVFKESDRGTPDKAHAKTFDWDELKEFFNGGTLGTKGVKTSGNETYEPPFRGTVAITQNAEVTGSEAIITRICQLWFPELVADEQSRESADMLNLYQVSELSHFLLRSVKLETPVLATFAERCKVHEKTLRALKQIRQERIIKNHAQMMALVECLKLVCPISDAQVLATHQRLTTMAVERQQAINNDVQAVAEFWEVYEYLQSTDANPVVNHSADPNLIAINLNEFVLKAANHRQQVAELSELRKLLKDSRLHKFIESNRPVHSVIRANQQSERTAFDNPKPTTLKCWIFKK